MKYAPFIHYYESDIYKNENDYYVDLEIELLELKKIP